VSDPRPVKKTPVPFRVWRWNGAEIVALRSGLPLTDRGFRYGWHLFESLAVRGGRVLLAREHLDLLADAARRNGFPFSRKLRSDLGKFFDRSSLRDGMLRVYLTAGPGAPAAAVTKPACYLTWEETVFPSPADLECGYRLVTRKESRLSGWGEKSGNYLAHCLALRDVRGHGADEALILDAGGRVVSCAMGNLLVWPRSGDSILTPSPASGGRSGAVLSWVRGAANLREKILVAADLRRARALAVTNSRLGVMPVSRLDGRDLPDPSPSLTLARRYLDAI